MINYNIFFIICQAFNDNNASSGAKADSVQTPNNKSITAVGFISSTISKWIMQHAERHTAWAGIDIGESVTVGLEARLLNGIKAKRHASKGEALEKSDADNILKCLLYGDVYFQKNNGYLIYLYKVAENRYLQMSIKPVDRLSKRGGVLNIPIVRNIQFLSDKQVKSKYIKNKLLEVIK